MKRATENKDKVNRILDIYTKLINGYSVNKAEEAVHYGVNQRTIQRDIDDIRTFLADDTAASGNQNDVIYDRMEKGFRLEKIYRMKFSNSEVLAICKILLDSRAFTKKEMEQMLDKLIECCVPESNKAMVKNMIRNEAFHYIEPRHKKVFIDKLWTIGQAIQNNNYIEIKYHKLKEKAPVIRKLRPAAIMFSEYYFYLTAFIDDKETRQTFDVLDDAFPTIYRVDRIEELKILEEKFNTPYKDRFEEGEFRKRVQFMYGGKLRRVKFKYNGPSIEAVLDRLPTAKVLGEKDGVYTVSAEVFGEGIEMWLRSQGEQISVL